MKTKMILVSVLLSACNTTTTTTTQLSGGKTVTVVTEKKASEGVITAITNAVLGGFLSVFESK